MSRHRAFSVGRRRGRRIAAVSFCVVAMSACGGRASNALEVGYDGECVIELEFARRATPSDVVALIRRVEGIPHVRRTELLSRAGNIARFEAAVREEGYAGTDYDRLMARARREAGQVLMVKADEDRHVLAIIAALGGLPATITSVAERDSCPDP